MICKHILFIHTVKWSNSSISNHSIYHKSTKLNGSKYCYVSLRIQLNISHLFAQSLNSQTVLFDPQIGPYQSQSWPGSNGNEGVLSIFQISGITEDSPDCLKSYPRHLLQQGWGSYPSAELQFVYSTAPADWAEGFVLLSD